ncbi:serine acetyltransferase [Cyanobacterium stanieri LEGE 03274]|uniref:Serine acetyltransferase n=1 Tax=Cyanobacterium stanieri LEGE 03274 TaxID=1828756 RepID=A0ABR9UZY8_9CHRO|nr:serine acetyltransferase [Cyanobacterium stanieri]MBE9221198.1 serine acetyltransferase [Cyanobacterium stanieri LEGE 03274]
MKKTLKKLWFYIEIIIFFPLLIPYYFTTEKELIKQDNQKWVEYLSIQSKNLIIQLITLLKNAPEYRNLYYFRLKKGNLTAKIISQILKIIYRPCGYFFLDESCNIGGGLFIQHGFSTIIMADMGENCWINQQVTIGYKDKTGRPKIGNNVRITAGAKVIGNIEIGDNVVIGANAVVTKNVPPNCVVVGIPAYIIKRDGEKVKQELR